MTNFTKNQAVTIINDPARKNIILKYYFDTKAEQDEYLQIGTVIGYSVGSDYGVHGTIVKRTDKTITVQLIKPRQKWKGDELIVDKTEAKWNWSEKRNCYQCKGLTDLTINPEEYHDPSF
jgi:hypothetical protein